MATNLSSYRKFERVGDTLIRREKPLDTFTKQVGECAICKQAIFAAPGQAVRTGVHKRCARMKGLWKK